MSTFVMTDDVLSKRMVSDHTLIYYEGKSIYAGQREEANQPRRGRSSYCTLGNNNDQQYVGQQYGRGKPSSAYSTTKKGPVQIIRQSQ